MNIDNFKQQFPFLSGIRLSDTDYVGIIQNTNDKIITFYDFNAIKSPTDRTLFLQYGDTWWWESNRIWPINIFIGPEMSKFRYTLKSLNIKDCEILFGPVTSLNNLLKKRIKKRQIQLVKTIK